MVRHGDKTARVVIFAYTGRLHLVQQDQDRYQVRQVACQEACQRFVLLRFRPSICNRPMNLKIFIVPSMAPQEAAEPYATRRKASNSRCQKQWIVEQPSADGGRASVF